MRSNTRRVTAGLAGAVLVLASVSATSANVDINIGLPGAYLPAQPVYVQPQRVIVQEQPIVVRSAPVYIEQEDRYWDCKKDKCKSKKYKKDKHDKRSKHHEHGHNDDN